MRVRQPGGDGGPYDRVLRLSRLLEARPETEIAAVVAAAFRMDPAAVWDGDEFQVAQRLAAAHRWGQMIEGARHRRV